MPFSRFSNLSISKQNEILRAATEEFGSYGFESASINRIIERAGISKGSMYYYFADKDDVYRTVLDVWFEEMFQKIQLSSQPKSPGQYWNEWQALFRRAFRFFMQKPVAAALLWQSIRSRASGTAHPHLASIADQMRDWVGELLGIGREIGAVRTDLPEGLLLETAFSMLEGFDRWLADRWSSSFEHSIEAIAADLTDLLRRIALP